LCWNTGTWRPIMSNFISYLHSSSLVFTLFLYTWITTGDCKNSDTATDLSHGPTGLHSRLWHSTHANRNRHTTSSSSSSSRNRNGFTQHQLKLAIKWKNLQQKTKMIILAIYFQQKNKWKQKYEAIPAKNKKNTMHRNWWWLIHTSCVHRISTRDSWRRQAGGRVYYTNRTGRRSIIST